MSGPELVVTSRRLLNGTEVDVRPISPSDADALIRFHGALSPESQRSRFLGIHPHLTPGEAQRFTTVDHQDREAFVALASSEIVGVGRYERLPATSDAEIAFVTRDDHQGFGIATILFQELTISARTVGITRFLAETLAENRRMLAVFAATGLVSDRSYDSGVVEITLLLPDPETTTQTR